MTYEQRLSGALALLEQHNSVVGTGNPGTVDPVKFTANLKSLGGTSEEALSKLRWENILQCLSATLAPNTAIQPEQLARDIASLFRSEETLSSDKPAYVGPKKVRQMTVRQLVEHFDPEEPKSEVGKRLSGIVGKSPCIVFEKHGSRTVDVDATYGLVNEIKGGFPARHPAKGEIWAIVDVRGTARPAYPIGCLPENFAEENPLYPGRPLRPDGTCDQTQRSWNGVAIKIRQFLRVGLGDEIKVSRLEDAHNLLDIVLQTDALTKLQQRYPQTKIKFEQ